MREAVADRETGTVKVYDGDGNLIETIPNGYSDAGGINVPFAGLPYGTYTVKVSYWNQHNKPVGNIYVIGVEFFFRDIVIF